MPRSVPITSDRMPRRARPARPARMPVGPLRLSVTAVTGAAHVTYLRRHIAAAHAILKPPLAELSIALVGDRRMAELHEQFLGKPGPTDVLTFPLEVDRRGRPLAGEVVVCVPEARRRSAAEGTRLRQEVLLYALHGLLHLCGFDDRTRAGFATMHRTEDAILTTLGIGPVFSRLGKNSLPPGVLGKDKRATIDCDAVQSPVSAQGKRRLKMVQSGGSSSNNHRPVSAGSARRASRRVD